jgi:hypothetical protein
VSLLSGGPPLTGTPPPTIVIRSGFLLGPSTKDFVGMNLWAPSRRVM